MIRFFLIFNILISLCFSADSEFTTRQKILDLVKLSIQNEESIARAYEEYIINTKSLPTDISVLKTADYLGVSFGAISTYASTYINAYTLSAKTINYRLKDSISLSSDYANIKALYEGDTFRKKTFFYDNKIHIILEDNLSKHFYTLLQTGSAIIQSDVNCENDKRYIIKSDNHLYVCNTVSPYDTIMYYHLDNYGKGPIIVKDDLSLYTTKDEFKNLTPGALIYDYTGVKYLKITDEIIKVE